MVISSKKTNYPVTLLFGCQLDFKGSSEPLSQERPDVPEILEHVVDRKEFKIRLADTHG